MTTILIVCSLTPIKDKHKGRALMYLCMIDIHFFLKQIGSGNCQIVEN